MIATLLLLVALESDGWELPCNLEPQVVPDVQEVAQVVADADSAEIDILIRGLKARRAVRLVSAEANSCYVLQKVHDEVMLGDRNSQ